jgi:broad specificity phosphatase PhoE
MKNHTIDIVAVRHAVPDLSRGDIDPELMPGQTQGILDLEERLAGLIPDAQKIAVFHSPTRRTLATARLILDTPWVSDRSQRGSWPQELAPLAEVKHLPGTKPRKINWLKVLNTAYSESLSGIKESETSAMILVTHAPVIKDMAKQVSGTRIGQPLHIDFLDTRQFKITIER